MTDQVKKRMIPWGIAGSLCILLIVGVLVYFLAFRKPGRCTVGFYNVDATVQSALTDTILSYSPAVRFITFDTAEKLSSAELRKCTVLITNKGAVTAQFEENTRDIPSDLAGKISHNLLSAHSSGKHFISLPILLDHFEVAWYRTWRTDAGLELPTTFEEMESYFPAIQPLAPTPAIVAGGNDREFLGFVSAVAAARLGRNQYLAMTEDIRTSIARNNPLPESLLSVLDYIKTFKGSALYPGYLESQMEDVEFFMKNHQLGSVFMSLQMHRHIPGIYIKYYDSTYVPSAADRKDAGIVCPTVCALYFSESHGEPDLLRHLLSDEVQEHLSNVTKLAPSSSRSPCYDVQSDDVRFWAAALPGGPLPGIQEACCISLSQSADLAANIRQYLK